MNLIGIVADKGHATIGWELKAPCYYEIIDYHFALINGGWMLLDGLYIMLKGKYIGPEKPGP